MQGQILFRFSLHLSRDPNVVQSVISLSTREDLGMQTCGVADMHVLDSQMRLASSKYNAHFSICLCYHFQ